MQRILESKLSESCNIAPSYYMYKDHKAEGGFRQVVGGCSSNTLGLSNLLSEVLESIASARKDPYEVISTEDMLARIDDANEKISELMEGNNAKIELSRNSSPSRLENNANTKPSLLKDQNELVSEIITPDCEITPDCDNISPDSDITPECEKAKNTVDKSDNDKWDWRDHFMMIGTGIIQNKVGKY